MPKAQRQSARKTPAPAPYKITGAAAPKAVEKKNPLFRARKLTFGVGQALPKGTDLTRFVKWPKYVRLQRQRQVLFTRLKTPPSINQFSNTLEKAEAATLFRIMHHIRPETKAEKSERLHKIAANQAPKATEKPTVLKYGLNHVTSLIEQSKAKLVVIAHDVNPIELVVWLPALCRARDVPYCIVKSKSRLGQLVHKKTAAVVAITAVKGDDAHEFAQLAQACRAKYNATFDKWRRTWGEGINGPKSLAHIAKRERAVKKEAIAKYA